MSKFIAFEGLDGSGNSTQIKLLSEYLSKKGLKIHSTKEPTNNLIGGLVRGQLTKQWKSSQTCLQLLFSADRAHHLEIEIEPALKKGNIVLTDRYMLSTFAFGTIDGLDMTWLEEMNKNFRKPDLTILLKVPPAECIARINKSRQGSELFEEVKKLEKVWNNYEILAKRHKNVVIIDGTLDPEKVHKLIVKEVEKIL